MDVKEFVKDISELIVLLFEVLYLLDEEENVDTYILYLRYLAKENLKKGGDFE